MRIDTVECRSRERAVVSLLVPALVFVAGVAVYLAGVQLSDTTDILSVRWGLGEVLSGLLLLAIATNFPELVITTSAATPSSGAVRPSPTGWRERRSVRWDCARGGTRFVTLFQQRAWRDYRFETVVVRIGHVSAFSVHSKNGSSVLSISSRSSFCKQ
ncbi:hypothetical protein [Natronorubrum halophilum]|uniref:hypothetical protein n=1 Tax=Natronorubrum halophilum TaxID=1702106 RepID=UPI003742FC0B